MNNTLAISNGNSFITMNSDGTMDYSLGHGFFFNDTRHLSANKILLNGENLEVLTSKESDYNHATIAYTNKNSQSIFITRDIIIDNGLFEKLRFINNENTDIELRVEFDFNTDFADIFEVKEAFFHSKPQAIRKRDVIKEFSNNKSLSFFYSRENFIRKTIMDFSEEFKIVNDLITFKISLKPKEEKDLTIITSLKNEYKKLYTPNVATIKYKAFTNRLKDLSTSIYPELETDYEDLKHLYDRSLYDLSILRINKEDLVNTQGYLTAAGLPWFMTVFGRDSLITSFQTIVLGNALAKGSLEILATYQGVKSDDLSLEQPGKIFHELRFGEAAYFSDWVSFPYYGTADATPLFLIMVSELYKWNGNVEFLNQLKPNILSALVWIDKYGDIDNDGFVEYVKAKSGLINQNWRDSSDSMQFSNGKLAETPIASSDIQGYIYDAKLRIAEIARNVWNENDLAIKLEKDALNLKEKFNEAFWLEEKGYFAMGLDKDKNKIDSLSSMNGHLLWSGIVNEERMGRIVMNLMSDNLFSGWGIRTLENQHVNFDPIGYHTGTIWPHDNSIIANGLYKKGFKNEALEIIEGIIETSSYFDYRLPELFSGFNRDIAAFPINYPVAASPQSWAAGSCVSFLTTMLGIEPDLENKTLKINPTLPKKATFINLRNIPAFGKRFSIEVNGNESKIIEL